MKKYETTKEKEYYVITPSKAHGETRIGEKIHFANINEIETFEEEVDYLIRLEELNIEYDND